MFYCQLLVYLASFLFFSCQPGESGNVTLATMQSHPAGKTENPIPPSESPGLVVVTENGGHTWNDASGTLPKNLMVGGIYSGKEKIIMNTNKGLYQAKTNEQGLVWEKGPVLPEKTSGLFTSDHGLYAITKSGILGQSHSGDRWSERFANLNVASPRYILEAGNRIYVAGSNGIFYSPDLGKTWTNVYKDGSVTGLHGQRDRIYATGDKGLVATWDGGNTWNYILKNEGPMRESLVAGNNLVALSNGPQAWDDPMANPSGINHILASADSGASWNRIDRTLPPVKIEVTLSGTQVPPRRIYDIENIGGSLFCSLDDGVFRSDDMGKSWHLILRSKSNSYYRLFKTNSSLYCVNVMNGC